MKYRALGNTGIMVSELGLGCECLTDKSDAYGEEFFRVARQKGANILDMYSPDPRIRAMVKAAIADKREEFYLQAHLCTVWQDGQYKATRDIKEVKEGFETMLSQFGTDYIDIGMIHYVDSDAVWQDILDNGIMDYALELKKQGRIRHIGVSSHNPKVALKMVNSGYIEVMMFSINPCYDLQPGDENLELIWADESYEKPLVNMDPERQELYETCQRLGVGITVMKAFGGGDLLKAEDSPAGVALTVNQCIHYALTRPAVASVMTGARTMEELEVSFAYEDASDEERDYAEAFATFPKISWEGHCMYCGHCAPCPVGIEVANVTKFLNLAKAKGGLPETVREHYGALQHTASECLECGACETRCPFGVSIIENMREAVKVFGK